MCSPAARPRASLSRAILLQLQLGTQLASSINPAQCHPSCSTTPVNVFSDCVESNCALAAGREVQACMREKCRDAAATLRNTACSGAPACISVRLSEGSNCTKSVHPGDIYRAAFSCVQNCTPFGGCRVPPPFMMAQLGTVLVRPRIGENRIGIHFILQGVDYELLTNNQALHSSLRTTLANTIADEVGVPREHADVQFADVQFAEGVGLIEAHANLALPDAHSVLQAADRLESANSWREALRRAAIDIDGIEAVTGDDHVTVHEFTFQYYDSTGRLQLRAPLPSTSANKGEVTDEESDDGAEADEYHLLAVLLAAAAIAPMAVVGGVTALCLRQRGRAKSGAAEEEVAGGVAGNACANAVAEGAASNVDAGGRTEGAAGNEYTNGGADTVIAV